MKRRAFIGKSVGGALALLGLKGVSHASDDDDWKLAAKAGTVTRNEMRRAMLTEEQRHLIVQQMKRCYERGIHPSVPIVLERREAVVYPCTP